MGEPADNAPTVRRAVAALCDGRRFGFSPSKVTVSTVAPTAAAFSALYLGDGDGDGDGGDGGPVPAIAWSLHAADATLRKELVPTARDDPAALRDGLCATLARLPPRRRKVMVEYVLLGGVNTRMCDADDLAAFLRPIEAACADPSRASKRTGVLVNLIPFNPTPGDRFERPGWEAIDAFQARLRAQGIWVSVRATRGADDGSACGQLWAKQPPRAARRAPAPAMVASAEDAPTEGEEEEEEEAWRCCL